MPDDETCLNVPLISTVYSEQVTHGRIRKASRKDLDVQPVVIIDPVTGRTLDATDFLSKTTATFQQQPDALLTQANPVSTTLYNVLPTTSNVRLISIAARVTWAVTQPDPLEVVVTIDGIPTIYLINNPVSATYYGARTVEEAPETLQTLGSIGSYAPYRTFLLEGRSVRVDIRVTWAVTQPTPLVCRVKWAKR